VKEEAVPGTKALKPEAKNPFPETEGDDSRGPRQRLLAAMPVTERRLPLAGVSTTVLEAGEGRPVVLLHGPGESAFWWIRAIPPLSRTHRVIIPDLPGHGASRLTDGALDADRVLAWLDELIQSTCASPPVLVGHLLGGAIAARFASHRSDRLRRLVLVDSLGLGPFRPSPRFAFGLIRFLVRPTERSYERFLPQCVFDLDGLREQMGEHWRPFLAYNIVCAREPSSKAALRNLMRQVGVPVIPPADLARIAVPTDLIWGRHDRAVKLRIAEAASTRYGWPLHVIESAADDPKLEQPEAFLEALRAALGRSGS
jgi:pimeloyl-ACP methyl ester carboxylesterase